MPRVVNPPGSASNATADDAAGWIALPVDGYEMKADFSHPLQLPEAEHPPGNIGYFTHAAHLLDKVGSQRYSSGYKTTKESFHIRAGHLIKSNAGQENLCLGAQDLTTVGGLHKGRGVVMMPLPLKVRGQYKKAMESLVHAPGASMTHVAELIATPQEVPDLDGFIQAYYSSRGINIKSIKELEEYDKQHHDDALKAAVAVSESNARTYADKNLKGQTSLHATVLKERLAWIEQAAGKIQLRRRELLQDLKMHVERVDSLPRHGSQKSTSVSATGQALAAAPKAMGNAPTDPAAPNGITAAAPTPTPETAPTPATAPTPVTVPTRTLLGTSRPMTARPSLGVRPSQGQLRSAMPASRLAALTNLGKPPGHRDAPLQPAMAPRPPLGSSSVRPHSPLNPYTTKHAAPTPALVAPAAPAAPAAAAPVAAAPAAAAPMAAAPAVAAPSAAAPAATAPATAANPYDVSFNFNLSQCSASVTSCAPAAATSPAAATAPAAAASARQRRSYDDISESPVLTGKRDRQQVSSLGSSPAPLAAALDEQDTNAPPSKRGQPGYKLNQSRIGMCAMQRRPQRK
jgi:hypothetical protein